MILKFDLVAWLTNVVEPFRDFVDNNHSNPLMWFSFVLIGMAVFFIVYQLLNKNG